MKTDTSPQAISKSIATTVPDEPPEDSTARICSLRFRVPKGETITRRFLAENTLGNVLNYLTSQGYHTEDYKVLTTFPRRDVSITKHVSFILYVHISRNCVLLSFHVQVVL